MAALSFGLSGGAFAIANLMMAHALSVEQFALMTLLVSIVNVASIAAPLGFDGAVTRKSVRMSEGLLRRVLLASVGVAALAATYARVTSPIGPSVVGLVIACICAGAIATLAAAYFQAEHAFGRSLLYMRSPDVALFVAAVVSLAAGATLALIPMAVMSGICVAVAAAAWRDTMRHSAPVGERGRIDLRETSAYFSAQLSASLLLQVERLLAGSLLSPRDLATLGVVMILAAPPFRLLQLSVGYALQPQLRSAGSHARRVQLLREECLRAAAFVALAAAALWVATPLMLHLLLHDKFSVSQELLRAVLIAGVFKVGSGITKAGVTALADTRDLTWVGVTGWIAVGVAIAGAMAGSGQGLSGIIYGVCAGWAVRVASAAWFVQRGLRRAQSGALSPS